MNINSIQKPLLLFTTVSSVVLITIGVFSYNQFGLFKDMSHGPGIMMMSIGGGALFIEGLIILCCRKNKIEAETDLGSKPVIAIWIELDKGIYYLRTDTGKIFPFTTITHRSQLLGKPSLQPGEFVLTHGTVAQPGYGFKVEIWLKGVEKQFFVLAEADIQTLKEGQVNQLIMHLNGLSDLSNRPKIVDCETLRKRYREQQAILTRAQR